MIKLVTQNSPAEGSREVIERELKRMEKKPKAASKPKSALAKPKPRTTKSTRH